MGLIKEPKGVDFIIKSEPLTKEEEEKLSKFIAKRKQEIAEMKQEPSGDKTKASGSSLESKRTKNAKTKLRSKQ
ncbi:hypothetical protein [Catalinimonas niigatensis]|uniref:hypothetical protein n=1 Tax=Catalinimonas niigatensis TaxID=1397264 RepID=UPI0026655BA8|nr:hypothetical protein [Catalinimonas niigatensis]WPP49400.1 hypothetical protein PZB72_22270 [Catalinimonas niigatensis]